MNCFGLCDFGGSNQGRNVQVALRAGCRANADRFIGQFDIFGFTVGFRVHDNRFDAHFAAGAQYPQGDLAAVGNQDFFKHGLLQ